MTSRRRSWCETIAKGRSEVEGFADDYAFVIQGLLDLYEASFDVRWLQFAIELQETQDRLFFDEEGGGYFSGTGNDPSILLRLKEDNDSAEPAASSVAALNLLRLAQFRNEMSWYERAEKTIDAFAPQIGHFASAMPQMLVALGLTLSKPWQIVIAGKRDSKETQPFSKRSIDISPEQDSPPGGCGRWAEISGGKARGASGNETDGRKAGCLRLRKLHLPGAGNRCERAR